MNPMNQRIAIIGLVALGLTATLGAVVLAWHDQRVPEPLTALAGVTVGALGSFMVLAGKNGKNGMNP